VGEYDGVLYVNDSKATNPDSAIKAMESYDRPILLIAGGDGKNVSFREFAAKVAEKAKVAVLIGKDREMIQEALLSFGFHAIRIAESLEEATALCHDLAAPGDVVLLSPACASYDMFTDYEERGRVFKATIKTLIGE
jgi:UDP-N-acetylmuramoylalanine--D-glutamate ligase